MTDKKRFCVLFVAACIAIVVFMPGPAAGTVQQDKPRMPSPGRPADLSAEDEATMNRQIPLTRVATHIRNLVEDGAGRPGFAGFAGLETPGDTLLLWWKGQLPKPIRDAVRRAKVPLEVRAAAYSKKELKAASTKLMKSSGVENGGPVHAVMMPFDGSGLEASVLPGGRARSLAAANQLGVPVTVVEREPMKTQYNRCNDSPPWYGGGAIFNTSVGGGLACGGNTSRRYHCSMAFSVALGGAPYMLTAGHCGAPGNTFHNTGGGGRIGQATHEHVAHDLMLIGTSLAGGSMWDGSVNQENYSKHVVRFDWAQGQMEICHSGATTGTGCGTRVVGSYPRMCNYQDIHGPWECYDDLIGASGGTLTGGGDSGGAWFTRADPNDPHWTQVSAVGSHTGYQALDGQMVFQDIGTATRDWPGLTMITW